jgi:hypothetical protein
MEKYKQVHVPKSIFSSFTHLTKIKTGFVLLGTIRLKSQLYKSRMYRRPTNMKNYTSTMAKPSSFVDSGYIQI